MKEVFIKTLSMGIVLCILTACTGRPSPSTYSNSSATSSDSNVEADNKNTEPTATGFKNLTRPYYSVLGCGGESGYYETRARDDGSANVTYIDYGKSDCIVNFRVTSHTINLRDWPSYYLTFASLAANANVYWSSSQSSWGWAATN